MVKLCIDVPPNCIRIAVTREDPRDDKELYPPQHSHLSCLYSPKQRQIGIEASHRLHESAIRLIHGTSFLRRLPSLSVVGFEHVV
jgi:hypothetical protein